MTQIDEEQDKLPANELASASSSNSALNAADPEDPNLLAPIVPLAPGGVLLEPNRADPDGLSVDVTYPSMSVHDTIALTFNGENTLVPQDGNGDLKVTFLVPKEYVAKTVGKTVQVFYRVTTNAGAVRSQTLDLDVKLIPLDKLLAPKILQAEGNVLDVGELEIDAVIYVNPWPLIALKQKMWMRLKGSGNLDLPVWQEDETSSIGAQVATVERKDLQNLTDGSQLNLVLEVLFDDGLPLQPFPIRTYQIKTAPEYALGALELVGATGDVIDLSIVSGDPVTVHAHAYIGQTVGDRLLLSWAGVAADGTPITFSREYTVQAGGETGEVQFEVPRANLGSLGGGTLQLSYQIIKVGGGIQNSPITTYSVTVATLNLPPPAVLEATPEGLAPMHVINGATVEIKYPNPLPSDVVALLWNGKNDAVAWEEGAGTIIFTVPPTEIRRVLGKTIDVQYAVKRGTTWSPSFAITLNVLPLTEGDLKMPKVTQASEGTLGVLDLSTFTGDAEIVIDPWPYIEIGQKVWLDMVGGTAPFPILNKHSVAPGEETRGISSLISRANLELIDDKKVIEFPAKVQIDGSDSPDGATNFPLLKLQLKKYIVEDFESYLEQNNFSGTLDLNHHVFTFTKPPLSILKINNSKILRLSMDDSNHAHAEFKNHSYNIVTIDVTAEGYDADIICYSAEPEIREPVPVGEQKTVEFRRQGITGLGFRNFWTGKPTTITIDNITMRT